MQRPHARRPRRVLGDLAGRFESALLENAVHSPGAESAPLLEEATDEHWRSARVGRTDGEVTTLGLGTAPLGGLFEPVIELLLALNPRAPVAPRTAMAPPLATARRSARRQLHVPRACGPTRAAT